MSISFNLIIIFNLSGLSVDELGYLVTVETDCGNLPCITKINPHTGDLKRIPFNLVNNPRSGNISLPLLSFI